MMTVLNCEAFQHNVWLVLLAALVCALGCWAVTGLFGRVLLTVGAQRRGWQFLTAIAAGSTIWCTHFVGILSYQPDVPISFDPILTIVSSLLAVLGSGVGIAVATASPRREAPIVGGALLGLSIAAMHYCGMFAYRVDGIVRWNAALLTLSIAISVVLSAAALFAAVHQISSSGRLHATFLLAMAIVGLHFTGMAAFTVTPLRLSSVLTNPQALAALALAIAGMSLLVIGTGVVSHIIDDETRTKARAQLSDMALRDNLTGLPNRKSFRERLSRELEGARQAGASVALIAINVNGFKQVNDQYGHTVGDAVLTNFARRFEAELRPGDFLSRVGGDEFAIISAPFQALERDNLLDRVAAALRRSIAVGDGERLVSASAGIAVFPVDAGDDETLINNADLALVRAKAGRVSQVCRYERPMDEGVRTRRKLAEDLRSAVTEGELEVFFQPQADVANRATKSFEALARWNHPQFGFVPPDEFIALAEEIGLIEPLGEWILRSACAQAATWEPPHRVAVNVSPHQLARGDFSRLVIEVLAKTGLEPQRLELELTESAVVDDPRRSLKVLRKIKALGVSLALDDFGSGHSSLAILRKFPFDKIKLDRAFMGEIETSKEAGAILKAVVALGRGLGIPVLAEGIETEGQLEIVRKEGCEQVQGYLLGRPAPMAYWLREGRLGTKTCTTSALPFHVDAA